MGPPGQSLRSRSGGRLRLRIDDWTVRKNEEIGEYSKNTGCTAEHDDMFCMHRIGPRESVENCWSFPTKHVLICKHRLVETAPSTFPVSAVTRTCLADDAAGQAGENDRLLRVVVFHVGVIHLHAAVIGIRAAHRSERFNLVGHIDRARFRKRQ